MTYREGDELTLTGAEFHDIHLDPCGVAFSIHHFSTSDDLLYFEPAALRVTHPDGLEWWWPLRVKQWRSGDGALLGPGWAFIAGNEPERSFEAAIVRARRALLNVSTREG